MNNLRYIKSEIFYLGVLYHRWNKLNAAEEMYKKALQLKPDLYSAKDNLQRLYTLKGSNKITLLH